MPQTWSPSPEAGLGFRVLGLGFRALGLWRVVFAAEMPGKLINAASEWFLCSLAGLYVALVPRASGFS